MGRRGGGKWRERSIKIGNESVPKIIINDTLIFFLNCDQHFGNSLVTITVSECCLINMLPCLKNIYSYFSILNGQPREPALCQLYRRTFVSHRSRAVAPPGFCDRGEVRYG